MLRRETLTDGSALLNDPLCPYIAQHSTSYDFTVFIRIGKPFVRAVAKVFATRAGGVDKATSVSDLGALRNFFGWIEVNGKEFPSFQSKLRSNHRSISVDEWELVLGAWRDDLVYGENRRSVSTRACLIRRINVLLEALIFAGVMRPVSRLAPLKNFKQKQTPKKCLAEVRWLPLTETSKVQVWEDASESRLTDALPSPAALETNQELGTTDHLKIIANLNKKRLGDLRKCAELELRKWSEHFNEGERLLASCDMPFPEIRRGLHTEYKTNGCRRSALMKLFPRRKPEVALPRYLTYVLHEHGGIIPFRSGSRYYDFHASFCQFFGGLEKVRAYLIPHAEAANAVATIFMVDTGANVSVCYSLDRDCLADSDVRGYKTVTGFKDRARGKLIISELPLKDPLHEISCIEALQTYKAASMRLADSAPASIKHKLFLHVYRVRGVAGITLHSAEHQFRLFLSRHQELRGLNLNADMIRPTVLFQAVHQSEGNVMTANALADHGTLSSTSVYVNRPSLRVIYERLTREFQLLFQVASISDIDEAPLKLQINSSQFQRLLKKAHQTGLGIACLNPKAGYQPKTIKGKNCEALDKCPRCPLRFVIATVPNITDLILFYWHLEKSRPEFEVTRPERWARTWLPWLIFAEVALEKVQRGPSAEIYQRAKLIAETRVGAGKVNLPPLG